MSNLAGHASITRAAVDWLAYFHPGHTIYESLSEAGAPSNVVARDLIDVVILGHWADFGQCHHFMRRFDGQSPREAYAEAVQWIRRNAFDAAGQLARQLRDAAGSRSHGRPLSSTQALGNALHATQDSFAGGHAERDASLGPYPGEIRRIKRYAGSEKDGHEEADKQWKVDPMRMPQTLRKLFERSGPSAPGTLQRGSEPGRTFSLDGWFAVGATMALLRVIAESATAARGDRPLTLIGFEPFRVQWLRPSPTLSSERDLVFDLIDRFYTGIRLGASNIKTINMDEDGLATALVDEVGLNTTLVHDVFVRLRDHYPSDSDDVAEIYVNHVRRMKGRLEDAVRKDDGLKSVLIQVMDEGWTSSGEKDCIAYLNGLK